MKEYAQIRKVKTLFFSAENQSGTRGGGGKGEDCTKLSPCVPIEPGEERILADTDGPGVIQHMWFTGYVGHSFILRIYWDNQAYPSVEAPLSAFFGCAYDENFTDREGKYPSFSSAVMMTAPGRGLNSYFEMPFREHCRITVENRGGQQQSLYYSITGEWANVPDNIAYFHAAYRQEHPVTKGKSYTVIDGIEGKGQFLGLTLSVGVNGSNTCWVEGEARMYLDGDRYPTVHYTGTEDYFGGSYGFGNDIYTKQYQTYSGLYSGLFAITGNQREQYNSQQRFWLYRFHVQDPIHFDQSFRMTLDNLGWTGPRYDDYTSVAFWYQTLPSAPLKELPEDSELCMK